MMDWGRAYLRNKYEELLVHAKTAFSGKALHEPPCFRVRMCISNRNVSQCHSTVYWINLRFPLNINFCATLFKILTVLKDLLCRFTVFLRWYLVHWITWYANGKLWCKNCHICTGKYWYAYCVAHQCEDCMYSLCKWRGLIFFPLFHAGTYIIVRYIFWVLFYLQFVVNIQMKI